MTDSEPESIQNARRILDASHEEIPLALFALHGNGIEGTVHYGNQGPEAHVKLLGTYLAALEQKTDQDAQTLASLALQEAESIGDDDYMVTEGTSSE